MKKNIGFVLALYPTPISQTVMLNHPCLVKAERLIL